MCANIDEAVSKDVLDGLYVVSAGIEVYGNHAWWIPSCLVFHTYGSHQAIGLSGRFTRAGSACVSIGHIQAKRTVLGEHQLDSYAPALCLRSSECLCRWCVG